MPQDFLVLSRGRWDEDKTPEQIQAAIDRFYAWYERCLADGRMKPGQRLAMDGKLVTRGAVVDGPFAEAKEVVGGYWFIVADSLEEAVAIAGENPCLSCGLQYEVRPVDPQRASAYAVASETPARRRGQAGAMERHPIQAWHALVQAHDASGLEDLLADDAVFISPVVHTPQRGKAVTTAYLSAAFQVFFNPSFRYVREIVGPSDAMLEFETEIDGVLVNGVDIIRWNELGQIVEFKVMVRPLKAIQLIHERMGAMLAAARRPG